MLQFRNNSYASFLVILEAEFVTYNVHYRNFFVKNAQ